MNNNILKKIYLIISMISLAILITVVCAITMPIEGNYNFSTSYMHKDKKIVEKEFYRSSIFELNVLRDLIYNIDETSKTTSDYDINKYIENYTITDYEEYTDEDGNTQQREKVTKPTKEEAIKYIEESNNVYKEEIKNNYPGIKYIINNKQNNYVNSNTKYKTIEEFKKEVKGYVNIYITKSSYIGTYTKEINGKVYKNNNEVNYELLNTINGEDFEIYLSLPKNPQDSNIIYSIMQEYNIGVKNIEILTSVGSIAIVVFLLFSILYKLKKEDVLNEKGILSEIIIKTPLEIWSILAVVFTIIGINCVSNFYSGYVFGFDVVSALIFIFLDILILGVILYAFKKNKNKFDYLKNSLTYKIYKSIKKSINNMLNSIKNVPLIKHIIMISILISGISLFIGLLLTMVGLGFIGLLIPIFIAIPILTIYIIKKISYLTEIMDGAEKIKGGDLNYKIDIKGYSCFTNLAENINNIGEGLEKSIDKQLKSERMRSELITNVSHDLKTPLTSIINYIQLIKKEEDIQPEYIKDYVSVLDSKSKRLKLLVEDLFEASKTSSGNIDLNMDTIEIIQLLEQSVGEMEEKLSQLNLDLKINMPKDKMYIYADGRRMYRVFENLLSNISKYSLQDTRVYIDLVENDEDIQLTMKNISAYELNMDASEITERFKRGDESRNTEGSGLGLAIAKDLVILQNGKFNIDIDGDLFKVILEFKKMSK